MYTRFVHVEVKSIKFSFSYQYLAGFEISGGPVARGHQIFRRTTRTLGSSGPTRHWNFPDQNCLKDLNIEQLKFLEKLMRLWNKKLLTYFKKN